MDASLAGNTVLNVLNELVSRGASQEYVRIVTVLVAPSALELISKQFPGDLCFSDSNVALTETW